MNKTVFVAASLAALLIVPQAEGRRLFKEKVYQKAWCEKAGGETEVVLADRSRVDCVTGEYAVEVEFAPKWAEAVGQSLYYSVVTGKRPGIVLIMEDTADWRFLERVRAVAGRFGVTVWTVAPGDGP